MLRMRLGIGMDTDHTRGTVLGDERAHPPDRGEGAAESSVKVAEAAELLG